MSRLKFYRVQPQFSGNDADGWSHSIQGSTMTVGATDHPAAARMVSHAIFNVIGEGWRVRHTYALVHEVTGEESPFGLLVDDAGTWVRVTYWCNTVETCSGGTYVEVKHNEERYEMGRLIDEY